ncbi:hypothetical protein Hanom_Chr00s000003g01603831 [Helianthus anomalus]
MNTLFVDNMSQKLNFLKPKFTLGEFGKKLLFLQEFQSKTKMFLVISSRLRINQDIINENDDELIQIRLADPIHQVHENSRSIGQTEWHDCELIMPVSSAECCFRNILFMHTKLMIPRTKIFEKQVAPCNWSKRSSMRDGARRYGALAIGFAPGTRSIWNSTWRAGGRPGNSSGNSS